MWSRKSLPLLPSLGLWLALIMVGVAGCAPHLPPLVGPPGLALEPGRYLTAVYRAPDFEPIRTTYIIQPFPVEQSQGVAPDTFQSMLQDELTRAWQANGLKITPLGDAVLSGTVRYVDIRGASLRWLIGKISANLVVSGAITRGGVTLFAFQDRIYLSSPLRPGPPAPKETELLLHGAARTLAIHLLNELLLTYPPPKAN
jgi:hypothetical protein